MRKVHLLSLQCNLFIIISEKLGSAELVEQVKLHETFAVTITCKHTRSCSVLLHGPSLAMLDEIERVLTKHA